MKNIIAVSSQEEHGPEFIIPLFQNYSRQKQYKIEQSQTNIFNPTDRTIRFSLHFFFDITTFNKKIETVIQGDDAELVLGQHREVLTVGITIESKGKLRE